MAGLSFEWLGFLFVVHLRRFFYIFLLVFMSWYPGPQIIIITLASIVLMIAILEFRPYSATEQNVQESFNEIVILVFCYHVILISDFVPLKYDSFRYGSSISMVVNLTLTVVVFLFNIILPIIRLGYLIFLRYDKLRKHRISLLENQH